MQRRGAAKRFWNCGPKTLRLGVSAPALCLSVNSVRTKAPDFVEVPTD